MKMQFAIVTTQDGLYAAKLSGDWPHQRMIFAEDVAEAMLFPTLADAIAMIQKREKSEGTMGKVSIVAITVVPQFIVHEVAFQ